MERYHYSGKSELNIMADAKNYNAFLENILVRNSPKDGKILDIGSGIGTFAKRMVALGYNVLCIEPDTDQFQILKNQGLNALLSADEVEDGAFDFIYSLNVLEHIENDVETLKQWIGKLKQGGRILIYVPAFNCLYSSFDKKVIHYRRYRRSSLKKILNEIKEIECEKITYTDSLGFFAAWLYKLLDHGDGSLNRWNMILFDRVIFPLNRFFDFIFSPFFGKNVYFICRKK